MKLYWENLVESSQKHTLYLHPDTIFTSVKIEEIGKTFHNHVRSNNFLLLKNILLSRGFTEGEVPENIQTRPTEAIGNSWGVRGFSKAQIPSMGEAWIMFGTTVNVNLSCRIPGKNVEKNDL